MMTPPPRPSSIALPVAPALAVGLRRAALVGEDGEIVDLPTREVAARIDGRAPLVVHLPTAARRLGGERFPAHDLLELYAFARPARFCLPTARGLAIAVGLPEPHDLAGEAASLPEIARRLLVEIAETCADEPARAIARSMARGGWPWGAAVLAALGEQANAGESAAALGVWRRLPEWAEHAPEPPGDSQPIEREASRARLATMLGGDAEARPQQADFASAATQAFQPREAPDTPRFVLAEAGTGVGKTLGYLAPATLWAERNLAPVWVSTYTRNLQHQIDRELDRLYPDPADKTLRVVIRKGRENYLCLLNFEEAVGGVAGQPHAAIALGLMARWAGASRDGDMVGGDFPAWLPDLVGHARTRGLGDRRGECIYAACSHYHKCFVERSIRRARRADIVIANHALVMVQAALGGIDDARLPSRYVFDEGHHVFDAADSAFAGALTGLEMHDLRRWLVGNETTRRSRARGLRARLGDLADGPAFEAALEEALGAARGLPGDGWLARLTGDKPAGPAESFLALARQQVHARSTGRDGEYGLEADAKPPVEGLVAAAGRLDTTLERIARPLNTLAKSLAARLDDESAKLDTDTRQRIEAIIRGLTRRAGVALPAWRGMLKSLDGATPPEFVDWLAVERFEGREIDIGMHRHWLDPTIPFATALARPAHGVLVTSATLTDSTGDNETDWRAAEARTGARHVSGATRASVLSPFDYAAQTRVLVITDVKRDDVDQVAAAYRELFLAARGGALGLFTAIQRLRAVHARLAAPIEEAGFPLYAQHVDALDIATLIDIFRAVPDSCLLGTDAVRDGVDVPGRSLRLIVFDRVPWPRPSILHRARRLAEGGSAYDDMLTRFRLKQAFGRLIRRHDDSGVFALIDSRLPSRLASAFPPGVVPMRVGLAQAIAETASFLARPHDGSK